MSATETLRTLPDQSVQPQLKDSRQTPPDPTPHADRPTPIVRDPIRLAVTGTLPQYLGNSYLYRIGPGVVDIKHSDGVKYNPAHYFDMPGFLHEYRIDANSNTVSYRNSCIAQSKMRAIQNTPSTSFRDITFGKKDPCRSLFGKFAQLFVPFPIDPLTGNTADPNISVTVDYLPGKGLAAFSDSAQVAKLDENRLAADHFFNFEDVVPHAKGQFSCAHGHYDSQTNEYINFTFKFGGARVIYNVFSVPQHGTPRVIASFQETARYIHSFAVTDNYVAMVLWPAKMHALKILFHQNFMAGLEYDESEPTMIYVISRSEDRVVAKYSCESFFCFHQINAYDTEDGIVIDFSWWGGIDILEKAKTVVLYGKATFLDNAPARLELKELQDAKASYPKVSTHVNLTKLSDRALEMPCVNPNVSRKKYSYAYGLTEPGADSENIFEIIKLDVTTGQRWLWGEKNTTACEPLFVADPNGVNEDDGCVLTIVSDKDKGQANMMVLDARSMTEIARATIPMLIPGGFHGKVVLNA